LGEEVFESFKHFDLGDILQIEGSVFRTKTNELTLKASGIKLLSKSLRPMPDKFHGLHDTEARYRQRYLDLLVNPESKDVFLKRALIIQTIRSFLVERNYLEVETPMMQPLAGGAVARPFVTHHNTLDMPLYLRIAPELYLKRLTVGGLDRVFEINRCFRNEGLSTKHNPEFTTIEFYQAYANYQDLMDLTETMIRHVVQTVIGQTSTTFLSHNIDWSKPFARMSLAESLTQFAVLKSGDDVNDIDVLRHKAKSLGISLKGNETLGQIQLILFEKEVEKKLIQPTFICDYPTEVSPLARRKDADPTLTDRFEWFVAGMEIANGFSELNDPEDQALRFADQAKERAAGDHEAMFYDADYIQALEYGMPPTAGEGIGIDRLVMLLTNVTSIKDVILFPLMRPIQGSKDQEESD
jgi:lysyl-tRNA synthetase, class II